MRQVERSGEWEADEALVGDEQEDPTVSTLRALGHPVRYRILELLTNKAPSSFMDNPCCPTDVVCVCRLLAAIDISPSALSHHLRILKNAGLVHATRAGIWIYYSAREETLAQVITSLEELRSSTAAGIQRDAANELHTSPPSSHSPPAPTPGPVGSGRRTIPSGCPEQRYSAS